MFDVLFIYAVQFRSSNYRIFSALIVEKDERIALSEQSSKKSEIIIGQMEMAFVI